MLRHRDWPTLVQLKAPFNLFCVCSVIRLTSNIFRLWTPFIVILAWCTQRPLSLLFDFYEMAVLASLRFFVHTSTKFVQLGACFLVNYVTADAKTNWAEGAMLVALYIMITLTTWRVIRPFLFVC